MNTFGENIRLSIFGESHGPAVGIVIDGLPPGFEIDFDAVRREMAQRAPGGELATPRAETDAFEVLSGVFEGRATAAPLCAVIRNADTRSGDYDPAIMRPGHADYTARVKFKGFSDYRGGGHFSGRLTAPLVFAGAIAKQILCVLHGITITACIRQIGSVSDGDEDAYRAEIARAKGEGDSVGGVIECAALGVPPGLGEPFFRSAESACAALLFSVPAVKGVEFGDGFGLCAMRGSAANDAMSFSDGKVSFLSNHNGGILGGITNGQPVIVRAAIKPTPSVAAGQSTVNMDTGENITHGVRGRHDPCIVPRAVPVVEACLAICLLDFLPQGESK
ncbi:MAG: chorismate synthase [Oscillospiraceae bacterium]|nr:chorismate synthase [Oscillospiraceae bacterium]